MAIKKNGSRRSDRNKIRRMHLEGYSIDQMANTLSITLEHVQYVINSWPVDKERSSLTESKAADLAAASMVTREEPENGPKPITHDDIKALTERLEELEHENAKLRTASKSRPTQRKTAKKVEAVTGTTGISGA